MDNTGGCDNRNKEIKTDCPEKRIYMGFPGEAPPFYAYEAVQIFGDCGAFPEFVPNQDKLWLAAGSAPVGRIFVPDFTYVKDEKKRRKLIKREIYKIMSGFTGYSSPWGCMTGVRPAKIVNSLIKGGMTEEDALRELEEFYLVSHDKALLALETALNQDPFLKTQREHPENISLYIGIPFCPTRCLYCSFTSHPIEKYRKRTGEYLTLLEEELRSVIPAAIAKGYNIESLYIGGGTPTSLSEEDFRHFMGFVTDIIDTSADSGIKEFSLEAGRPDSITEAKLECAAKAGVTRISINPQTMNDKTLEIIGRRHTASETEAAFHAARDAGFTNINMDIIAGLPGEDVPDFEKTLSDVCRLRPDSMTVHTLSVKRAADLKRDPRAAMLRHDITGKMLSCAYKAAKSMDMRPFYMYRQKNMLGNLENVSYCRVGCESPYNIHIMEEDQTVLAFGAGGVSKLCAAASCAVCGTDTAAAEETAIERSFNVKGVEDYMARSREMAERKRRLMDL